MSGETDLNKLLQSMQPVIYPGEYVFCSINNQDIRYDNCDSLGMFRESEGVTLILRREQADAVFLAYTSVFCLITLSVHSSLEAVGFLAAVISKLAEHNISVNPVSGYYHDHLFVPVSRAEETMLLLQEFSK